MSNYKIFKINGQGKGTLTSVPPSSIIEVGTNIGRPVGSNEGGPTDSYYEVTRLELNALISSSTLVVGALYKVTAVDSKLYGGTDVYLKALAVNAVSSSGFGKFYNPRYDSGYLRGIYNTDKLFKVTAPSSISYVIGDTITLDNASTAKVLSVTLSQNGTTRYYLVKHLTGDWGSAYTPVPIGGVMVTTDIKITYVVGDTVIWGGYCWECISNTGVDDVITPFALDTEKWTKVKYSDEDYVVVYDRIIYDRDLNVIMKREDNYGNVVESFYTYEVSYYLPENYELAYNSINLFQWGVYNYFKVYPALEGKVAPSNTGVIGNKIIGRSCLININSRSYYKNCTLSSNSEINDSAFQASFYDIMLTESQIVITKELVYSLYKRNIFNTSVNINDAATTNPGYFILENIATASGDPFIV